MRVAVSNFGKEPSQGSLCLGNKLRVKEAKSGDLGSGVWGLSSPGEGARRPGLSRLRGSGAGGCLSFPKVSLQGGPQVPGRCWGKDRDKRGRPEQLIRSPGPHPNNFSISSLGVCTYKKVYFY